MTKENNPNHYFKIVEETGFESFMTDTYTFLVWIAPLFVNRYYLGDKWYISLFFLFMGLLMVISRLGVKIKKFKTKEELIKYIND